MDKENLTTTSTLDTVSKKMSVFVGMSNIAFNVTESAYKDFTSKIGTRAGKKPYTFGNEVSTVIIVPNNVSAVVTEDLK